jgi:hypothetical protein
MMTEQLYQSIAQELEAIQTPEEEQAFDQLHIKRVKQLTPEEKKQELAFLEQKLAYIEAKVQKYKEEK